MGEPVASAQDAMPVSEHVFLVADQGVMPRSPLIWHNGLTVTQPGVVVIRTGISSGRVTVTAGAYLQPPPLLDPADWDEIVELSVQAPTGRMVVTALMTDCPDMPPLTAAGPGHYRLRVYARGRDTAVDHSVDDLVEGYVLAAWPQPPQQDTVIKQTDHFGAAVRARWSNFTEPTSTPAPDPHRAAREAALRRGIPRSR